MIRKMKMLTEIEKVLPSEIEKRSFEIITEELGDKKLVPGTELIVKRCIHTSADFDYAENLVFSEGAVEHAMDAIRRGTPIVTDTQMGKAGINKRKLAEFGSEVYCFMSDEDVAAAAKANGTTRAAAARTKDPVRQGLVSMTGTFIDTIVICTMTGLSIVIAGSWLDPKLEGVAITMDAFQKGLPFPGFIATFSLMLCLVFFAFTTILGWDYYGERCVEYLFNRNKAVVKGYRWLYILAVFIGPYMTVAAVWNIADIFNALMAFPNLIALLALSGVVVKETKEFHAKHKGSY